MNDRAKSNATIDPGPPTPTTTTSSSSKANGASPGQASTAVQTATIAPTIPRTRSERWYGRFATSHPTMGPETIVATVSTVSSTPAVVGEAP